VLRINPLGLDRDGDVVDAPMIGSQSRGQCLHLQFAVCSTLTAMSLALLTRRSALGVVGA
jgi:hypothetical protein